MNASAFDNLPRLSREECFEILNTPVNDLNRSSDYYKAIFHLSKYPGIKTEDLLLKFLKNSSNRQEITLAKRKAIEVLVQLECNRAIPEIAYCLDSKDHYLVENAAWALKELCCQDLLIHKKLADLLRESNQNTRVLIQSLGKLGSKLGLNEIKKFVNDSSTPPGILGASIASLNANFGEEEHLYRLEKLLFLPNQNDRQCAIQDVIDANALNMLPSVLISPVAPYFRLRAVTSLWNQKHESLDGLNFISIIDSIIKDDPCKFKLLHTYEINTDNEFLINEFFHPDFSRSYLALKTLLSRRLDQVWPVISNCIDSIKKDYGAIYFLALLFKFKNKWPVSAIDEIKSFSYFCLEKHWPDFIKFKPISILNISKYDRNGFLDLVDKLLDEKKTDFWLLRYSTLLALEGMTKKIDSHSLDYYISILRSDSNRIVREKVSNLKLKNL